MRSRIKRLIGQRVVFVDWNLACRSNPELDLGFWLPSLAYEGGPAPERLLPGGAGGGCLGIGLLRREGRAT
jgi:hypothetical protein